MAKAPKVERLNSGKPILEPVEKHPWESQVTFNPACAFVADKARLASIIAALPFDWKTKDRLRTQPGLCFLLYRAQGLKTKERDFTHSSIGLAVLSPKLELLARHSKPVLEPTEEYENLGIEDGRITRVGNRFIMTYTAYGSGKPENSIRIAVASTSDFVHWQKHGLLKGAFNQIDNKNAMIFEEKSDGKFLMLHRPMSGADAMAIHWAESEDIFGEWKSRGVLMKPVKNTAFTDTWIGGGAPPLRLAGKESLLLYHIGNRKADKSREYDLGIAVLDPSQKEPVIKRVEPLMRPEVPAETTGNKALGVNNVLFVCGAYFFGGDLYFPYAGADSAILGARIVNDELTAFLAA